MRIALLADVHANREALSACLAHAARCGAEHYVFLGDLVGYGADPEWVIDAIMERVRQGAVVVLGNHDQAAAHEPASGMRADIRRVLAWTRAQLGPARLEFLRDLPLTAEEGGRLYAHANAYAPDRWGYVLGTVDAARSLRATRCAYTFCGHVHTPTLFHMGADARASRFEPVPGTAIPLGKLRRWLIIPGSVGQPRDGIPAACYALFDDAAATLTFFRVPYDIESAAGKIRAAGLPPSLATRLETGL
ncbi:MAG TPA: metallophosphoesterase family protein [Burkholderiales bacterium]|nr:metallophosphoesterase family protein [Burkholderiales bacterium]